MLGKFDAREVAMHYKRKGDRVDEVLHNVILGHVNRLESENKRLQKELDEAVEFANYKIKLADDVTGHLGKELDENKRLREALEEIEHHVMTPIGEVNYEKFADELIEIARKALEGDSNA